MNEGAKNQQKELEEIKTKEINKETNKTPIVVHKAEGSTKIDKVYGKVVKQESIKKNAQKDEDLHKNT